MIGSRLVQGDNGRDLELVQDLAAEIWREHYTPIIGSAQVEYMLRRFQSASAIAEQIAGGSVYYLLLNEEVSVGYVGCVRQGSGEGVQLSKLYVRREQRGLGLGRHGLELAQELCLQLGEVLLWLTVNKNNRHSVAWYRHMGFEHAGAQVADIGGGFVMDDYILEKRLAPERKGWSRTDVGRIPGLKETKKYS